MNHFSEVLWALIKKPKPFSLLLFSKSKELILSLLTVLDTICWYWQNNRALEKLYFGSRFMEQKQNFSRKTGKFKVRSFLDKVNLSQFWTFPSQNWINFKPWYKIQLTISSPGLQLSTKSPLRITSLYRGSLPAATLLGLSWILIFWKFW